MTGSKGRKALILAITFLLWTSVYVCIPYQAPFLTGIGISATLVIYAVICKKERAAANV